MKYVIVGCGRVGSQLAKLLSSESHEVVVVDENPAAFKRLGSRFPAASRSEPGSTTTFSSAPESPTPTDLSPSPTATIGTSWRR